MLPFDIVLLCALGLFVLHGIVRGFVRSLVSLLSWVVALLLATQWAPVVARTLAGWGFPGPPAPVVGFVAVFVAVLLVGTVIGHAVARMLRAVGLGLVDRTFGALFGLVRGAVLLVVVALVAGITWLPRHVWWQNSQVAPRLAQLALALAPYLPPAWADRLDYSAAGRGAGAPDSVPAPRNQRT